MRIPYKEIGSDIKHRYINKALQFLALKPSLLDKVETDRQLLDRVSEFAELLYSNDPDQKLF